MNYKNFIRESDEILRGDVLLCYSNCEYEEAIEKTNSAYCHAALVLEEDLIAEAYIGGIRKVSLNELLAEYEYVTILRRPDIWSPKRINALEDFVERAIQLKAKFNLRGMKKFKSCRTFSETREKLESYFSGEYNPSSPEKSAYFCSEFVVAAFIYVGIIEEAASIVIEPSSTSPGDIGRNALFGHYWGYILSSEEFEIPEQDDFYYTKLLVYP